MIDQLLQKLNAYSALGFKLFPCSNQDKRPLTQHGFKDASSDPKMIEAWAQQFSDCAWGTPTASSRAAVDIDVRHGGHLTWAKLIEQHGDIPLTPSVKTGGGGWHHYLILPEGTRCGKLAPGIDIKADGGYVIVPPSKILIAEHEGRSYVWENQPYMDVATAPDWLVELARKPLPSKPSSTCQTPEAPANPFIVQSVGSLETHPGASEGQRRVTLCALVGSAIARGLFADDIWRDAESWAGRCQLPFDEWERHVAGLFKKEEAKVFSTSFLPIESIDGKEVAIAISTSFLPIDSDGETELETDEGEGALYCPPPLADAYHGLLGQMAKAVEPELEPSSIGFLLNLMNAFGHAVGNGPTFKVGADDHHANLFTCLVGESNSGKGQCWAWASWSMKQADPHFQDGVCDGLSSGEGLIQAVADSVDDPGICRKLLANEQELAKCIRAMRREGNTLSPVLRSLWDGVPVGSQTKAPIKATNAFVGIVASITPAELFKLMDHSVEVFNGFANRFLWCEVRRERHLPDGGDIGVLKPFLTQLANAITKAKSIGHMARSLEAGILWHQVYPSLMRDKSGEHGVATSRSRPQVMRLAMIYALADGQAVIGKAHLRAALALWAYCDATAGKLFGGSTPATPAGVAGVGEPDPLWLRVFNLIQQSPGIPRGEITYALKNVAKADDISKSLDALRGKALAFSEDRGQGGRLAECWFPASTDEGEGEEPYNTSSLPLVVADGVGRKEVGFQPLTVSPDAASGKEGSWEAKSPADFLPAQADCEMGTDMGSVVLSCISPEPANDPDEEDRLLAEWRADPFYPLTDNPPPGGWDALGKA